ncbi:MAG: putative porin [Candidatus Omnitrophica bacterium]|nr:putative porin [Candidatus Omnitrophota bacterium]
MWDLRLILFYWTLAGALLDMARIFNDITKTIGNTPLVKINRIIAIFSLIAVLFSTPVWADVDPAQALIKIVEELKKEVGDLKQTVINQDRKIQDLSIRGPRNLSGGEVAANNSSLPTPPMSDAEFNDRLDKALTGSNKWLKDLKLSGDLRLRYEGMDGTSGNSLETDPRNRFRFRLRYGVEKGFGEEMKIGFSMSSAEQVTGQSVDPTSTNVTFTNLFDFKNIFIDKAYASYTPNWAKVGPIEKLEVTAGKANNPFEIGSSELIWDRDVKPEGVYEKINFNLIDSDSFDLKGYLLGGQYILQESGTLAARNPLTTTLTGDSELWAVQGALNPVFYIPVLERPVDFLTAFSYYNYMNYGQNNNFFIGATSLARGNPNVSGPFSQLDAREFQVLETYNEVAIYPYGFPTRFFLDVADNVGANAIGNQGGTVLHNNLAWSIGTRLGQLKKKGDWEARYEYRYLGANALVGAFSDSDFGLTGGTGKKGSVIRLGYMITDSLTLAGNTSFVSNLNSGTAGIIDEAQRRLSVDLVWKF